MIHVWQQWEGQVLNVEYPLRQYLGGSDHSAVFLTDRGGLKPEKAVIKLIPADPDRAKSQLSCLEAAARLSHPGLVPLYQVGLWQRDGRCWLYVVMEYAEETLAQVLPERPLTVPEMREVLVSTADALGYVHRAGFAHGHLKPSNIMAVDNQVKLSCDWLIGSGNSASLRTPGAYDPPEADRGAFTPAGDIWALAMILVEALTQRLPAREGVEERLALPGTLPAWFVEMVRQCLQEEPRRRWSADRIAQYRWENSSAVLDRPSVPPSRASSARNDVKFLAALGFGLATVLIGPQLFFHASPRRNAPPAVPTQTQSVPRHLPAHREPEPIGIEANQRRPSPFEPQQIPKRSRSMRDRAASESARPPVVPLDADNRARPDSTAGADRELPTRLDEGLPEGGRASYFSSKANGGHTASGAILNSAELVAAHASYPLGSRVRVTNLANGRTIEVLIVDRLPNGSKRVISLSEAAAKELGFIQAGTAQVRLELVRQQVGL